jgi:hypothetical protein
MIINDSVELSFYAAWQQNIHPPALATVNLLFSSDNNSLPVAEAKTQFKIYSLKYNLLTIEMIFEIITNQEQM